MNIINIEKIKNNITFNKAYLLIFSSMLIVSLILFFVFYPGKRVVYIFESMDSSTLYSEARYIPRDASKDDLSYFIDELLLGPISNRYKPLFANGTRALSCILTEENILYINLSENALFAANGSSETLFASELLKINVRKNYKHVDIIKVFIMGNLVTQN